MENTTNKPRYKKRTNTKLNLDTAADVQQTTNMAKQKANEEEERTLDDKYRDLRMKMELKAYLEKEEMIMLQQYIRKNLNEPLVKCPVVPPKDVITFFEKIISTFNCQMKIVDHDRTDSAFRLVKVKDDYRVAYYVSVLLTVFSNFPYSVYRKLKIGCISFWGAIEVYKENFIKNLISKLYGWNFILDSTPTPAEIIKHFFNTIWYNL